MISRVKCCFLILSLYGFSWSAVAADNRVTDIDFTSLSSDQFEIGLQFLQRPPEPKSYEIAEPARLVLDFADVQSQLAKKKYPLSFENARDAVVVSDGSRTRLIVNLNESAPFVTRIEGDRLMVKVGADQTANATSTMHWKLCLKPRVWISGRRAMY